MLRNLSYKSGGICKRLNGKFLEGQNDLANFLKVKPGQFYSSERQTNPHPIEKNINHRPVLVNSSNINSFMDKYENFLIDCDGVLWETDHHTNIPKIDKAINNLRKCGKRLFFVTNNSKHCRYSYLEKFRTLAGFEADVEEIFAVAYASAIYLKDIAKIDGKVYVLGSTGMKEELNLAGIKNLGVGPDNTPITFDPDELKKQYLDPEVAAVIVGMDIHVNFNKLIKATSYASREDCLFMATNDQECGITIEPGRRVPITGAILAAVSSAARRDPIVIGKPHSYLYDCLVAKNPCVQKSKTVMVGDSSRTDIPFAVNIGIDSLAVLTGVSTMQDLVSHESPAPDFYLPSFAHLADLLH